MLQGIKNKINRIYVVGNGTKLTWKEYLKPYWSANPGLIFIDLPETVLDSYMTILAVVLDKSLKTERL
jgi:alpha-L-fucosidase